MGEDGTDTAICVAVAHAVQMAERPQAPMTSPYDSTEDRLSRAAAPIGPPRTICPSSSAQLPFTNTIQIAA